jgi:hypothetical protein
VNAPALERLHKLNLKIKDLLLVRVRTRAMRTPSMFLANATLRNHFFVRWRVDE